MLFLSIFGGQNGPGIHLVRELSGSFFQNGPGIYISSTLTFWSIFGGQNGPDI